MNFGPAAHGVTLQSVVKVVKFSLEKYSADVTLNLCLINFLEEKSKWF
jgi:hypothetical protein